MMTDELVITKFDAETGVATLTFNRPDALNAINVPMAEAFLSAVQGIKAQPGLRCVILTGAGRAFMAGGDISSMAGTPEQASKTISAILDAVNPAIILLRSMDAPVIAAVKGVAAGAGLSLALMADLLMAREDARFLVAYNGIGAVPDCGGSWFLPHKIGAGRAAEMMILGRTLTAREAKNWGLVTAFAPEEQYEKLLSDIVRQTANGPTRAFGAFRRLTDRANTDQLAAHLEAEKAAFQNITHTADFAEGVAAFLAKRTAEFRGR